MQILFIFFLLTWCARGFAPPRGNAFFIWCARGFAPPRGDVFLI